ncbi:MAG: DUF4469 domain-containing protein [Treponema sp.]|nr:DUF4469 domain-containing protein [Treponema sp.]
MIKTVNEKLNRIRAKLYPNYLPSTKGTYIARTNGDTALTIEEVCAALKNRGGYTGNYEDLIDNVKQFYDEVAYQLCNGNAVNTGYYSIHPNIGGTFDTVKEPYDNMKNPISFRFRQRSKLRRLTEKIAVKIEGLADVNGFIGEFYDFDEKSTNSIYVPGDQFRIKGYKIKISGDDPSNGVYFVPVMEPDKAVKVSRLATNNATLISGIAPKTEFVQNRIEIRTQYAGSSNIYLKNQRIITSSFILEEA